MTPDVALFETHRRRLFGLAYRMLGSASEAEDVVQDAYLRWHGTEAGAVREAGGWLVRVVTNLCLNRLTAARAVRERYVGPWLPEPVLTTDGALGPVETVEQRDSVSMALLVLMEALSPAERAAVVLHEAFGYSHRDVAEVLGYTETNCRQVYARARRRLRAAGGVARRPVADPGALLDRFLAAARDGDLAGLERLLADDVASWADGGGRAGLARRPVYGRAEVARYLLGATARFGGGLLVRRAQLNGVPGLLVFADRSTVDATPPGRLPWLGTPLAPVRTPVLVTAAVPEYAGEPERITAVRIIGNPDKLGFPGRQAAAVSRSGGLAGS
ncbi:RNA polymerase sigma factor SigJ [Actinocatenispora rupis]|uniref:DNA-directed RNA polymerase sigma-70 factor n=1 Tax=Actinocatenispora rupis TaxID=519421 RepID=A0A8J3J3U4_9ACTN|nr:RNA polymerase sigma factor SigJ [Actinocatenispora rupis]GID11116.1 DNA-directed RNA polymerase sigma-70 factor [Actinocatenispora rupis]